MNLLKGNEDLSCYREDWGDKRGLIFLSVALYLPCFITDLRMWSIWNKLTSLPMCGFIAQLVEQRTGNAEVTAGSNPVEALIFFFFRLLLSSCLNWKIYCDDHSSLSDLRIFTSLSAQNCDFKHPKKMIWDRIVFGTNSPKVRENPISKGFSLILDKAVDIAWSFRASQAQLSATAARQ